MSRNDLNSANGTQNRTTVIIVGGGIGGLGAALALQRSGAKVTLLERAAEFGEVGAGLQLAPNATRVLKSWGLLDEVISVGVIPENLIFRDATTGEELTRQAVGKDFQERYDAPYVLVHRSDLHRILVEATRRAGVELITGTHVERVETVDENAIAHTADGRSYRADVVIGADGLHSVVRKQLSDDEPVMSGFVAFRGAFPVEQARLAGELKDVIVWMGPDCHFVQYALRGGQVLNQVAVFRSPAVARGEQSSGDELRSAYENCVPQVREATEHIWTDRNWPMFDREPVTRWADGRMVMLGDAAHPMLQYLAQGACQALEDADELAFLARKHVLDPTAPGPAAWPTVLSEFVNVRAPRTAEVQTRARVWGESWHVDGIGRVLRNELFRRRDTKDHRYLDWLYGRRRDADDLASQATQPGLTGSTH